MTLIGAVAAAVAVAGCGGSGSISDASTCAKWDAASSTKQIGYADEWLSQNPSATAAAYDVVLALNNSCSADGSSDVTLAKRLSSVKFLF